jgi:FKBP-type peptidyl-prolyl cis-trans isomerase SlpA
MNEARKLRIGDLVTLHYRLTCKGEEIVSTFADQPETFRIGGGDIDPRLEVLLTGLRVGEQRTYELEPGAAFGNHEPQRVHSMPRDEFAADLMLAPGHEVEFTLPNGQTLRGIIRALDDTSVQVDFNHPLAGLPVEFEARILAIETDSQTD